MRPDSNGQELIPCGYAFHPDAFADLDEIWEYIAKDNVDAADRVLADILSILTTLVGSPQIGHQCPDLTTRPLRFHVVPDAYLVAYAPAEKPLWVLLTGSLASAGPQFERVLKSATCATE
jgi:plasmid stabilization system protein ParE